MVLILRDRVVLDRRILRLIAMRHGRETTLSLILGSLYSNILYTKRYLYYGTEWIWHSSFPAYRDASREGEGKGEETEKRLPCNPESESLQGVSSCCAKTHRRAYRVTPDLRWHGQQLPYSSLYVSREYSTSVDGILSHKLLETISVLLYTHTYVLIAVVVVSTRYNKHTLHRTYIIRTTCLFQYIPGN